MAPVSVVVVGAGERGTGYARWARRHPDRASVVAVAEPREPRSATTSCWKSRWRRTRRRAGGSWRPWRRPGSCSPSATCCGTRRTRAVKEIVDSGQLGDIMSVQHLEPVGFWHQAHAYVRGNWRRADLAASMLMAKSCHDLDWLAYVLGRAPLRAASFGSLTHFTAAKRPAGAADRCVACSVEADCPYSAPRLYRDLLARGDHRWPLSVVIDDFSPAALDEALRDGPYGRCVYACDNDVVDHQVVALEFPGAATATFTMTAFTKAAGRSTRLSGTRGELTGDGQAIRVYDFLTRAERLITPARAGAMNAAGGHGGGDAGLMGAFISAVATGNRDLIKSGPRESLVSHLAVFAAERARLNGTVETIPPHAAAH